MLSSEKFKARVPLGTAFRECPEWQGSPSTPAFLHRPGASSIGKPALAASPRDLSLLHLLPLSPGLLPCGCSLDAVTLVSASVCTEATALPSAQPPRPPVAPAQPLPAPPQGRVSHLQPLQGSSRCRCWCPRWASLAAAWAQPRCAPPPCHLRNKEHRAEVSSVSHPECFCAGPFTFCSL